jgi:hypothetical protein
MIWNPVLQAALPLLSINYQKVITEGEIAHLMARLAEQSLILLGAGLLLGLGVGTILSAAGVYLFKQRQFEKILQT